jgi:hypothetical protein
MYLQEDILKQKMKTNGKEAVEKIQRNMYEVKWKEKNKRNEE